MNAQESSLDKEISPMRDAEPRTLAAFTVFALAFSLFCLWFLFSLTPLGHHVEAVMGSILPAWFVAANLVLLPCLMTLAAGGWRIPPSLRLGFGVLMLFSAVIFQVSFRKFLLGSFVVLAIILVEAYWIIPRWNARHRQANESK
jgi:hypothetical protein